MSSKACGLKWHQKLFSLHINQTSSCCRAYPNGLDATKPLKFYLDKWQSEKEQLEQGIRLPGCDYCWAEEDQGLLSYRLLNPYTRNGNDIDIFVSNLCNQMCSYCSPKYSSVWQETMIANGPFTGISASANQNLIPITESTDNVDYWVSEIQSYINTCADNSVSIKLLGGEPLMQVKNLEKLLNFNRDKIRYLIITTNLNPPTNKFLHWTLDNLPKEKLQFYISLDATPDFNHIPRSGFDKDKFLENLDLLKHHQINFKFSTMISVLSVFDLENFIQWAPTVTTMDNYSKFSKINNPACLRPEYLPDQFKSRILEKIQLTDLPDFVKEIFKNSEDVVDLKLFEQYNYLTQYFERSSIDPFKVNNDLFVEYWAWLTKEYK